MKLLTLTVLAASFALATLATADPTTPNTKTTPKTIPTATTQAAPAPAMKMDPTKACSKPMDKPECAMHCGM